ncbi:MAG: hypothetical protein J6J36_03570 [Clostridia bacterium]|nr:hypothetical protein [Clostridia bacterium]
MGLWEKIKKIFKKNGDVKLLEEKNPNIPKTRESYMKRLKDEAENITDEQQLKTKFAYELGITPEILNLPGAKDYIFSLAMFKGIKDRKTFDALKEQKDQRLKIVLVSSDDGKQVDLSIDDNEFRQHLKLEYIPNMLPIRIETINDIMESRQIRIYDNDGLEVKRIVQDGYTNEYYTRNSKQLSMVNYQSENIPKMVYDISTGDGDIATLDNVQSGEIVASGNAIMDFRNKQERNQQFYDAIHKSKWADIFNKRGYKRETNSVEK